MRLTIESILIDWSVNIAHDVICAGFTLSLAGCLFQKGTHRLCVRIYFYLNWQSSNSYSNPYHYEALNNFHLSFYFINIYLDRRIDFYLTRNSIFSVLKEKNFQFSSLKIYFYFLFIEIFFLLQNNE